MSKKDDKKQKILLMFKMLEIKAGEGIGEKASVQHLGTILSNLAYYGFTLSKEALDSLQKLSKEELTNFWKDLAPLLKELTGAHKNMDKYVVYKNFPKETLDMSEAQYWLQQTLLYLDVLEVKDVAQMERPRSKADDIKSLKVLGLAGEDSLSNIYKFLMKSSARWTENQEEIAKYLIGVLPITEIKFEEIGFKENAVKMALWAIEKNKIENNSQQIKLIINSAQDVLRLLAGLSGGDVSLREKTKFKKMSRPGRREILGLLDSCQNLEEDVARNPELWKKVFYSLHPGDYKFENVKNVYDKLYKDELNTFSAQLTALIDSNDTAALELVSTRPGEFVRKLHHLYEKFGEKTFKYFAQSAGNLKTIQLLKLHKYLESINQRKTLIYAPRGNWSRAQIAENKKTKIEDKDLSFIQEEIKKIISWRLNNLIPQGVNLDKKTDEVKLQTNDQKLATYGRGTQFEIEPSRTFARSASYWATPGQAGNIWYDNSWNFFDAQWNVSGACCWNAADFHKAAIFSGDPVNSKTLGGHACQMIDLYFDKLKKQGVKYAVWSILCYSRIPFSKAESVLATLQTGDNPEKGNLYEPARADMAFPVTGDSLTKFIAMIDIESKKLIYLDANLGASVSSGASNGENLSQKMPAYMEYVESLPSVYDLFKFAKPGNMEILYEDKNVKINNKEAYVFLSKNPDNKFKQIDINAILEDKTVPPRIKAKP